MIFVRSGSAPTGFRGLLDGNRGVAVFARRFIPAVLPLCLLLSLERESSSAETEPKGRPSPAGDAPVDIVVVGTPSDLKRIRSAIDPRPLGGSPPHWTQVEQFDPMEVLRSIRDPQKVTLVRCWVDVADPTVARLYFAARSGQQFLVRDLELSGGFNETDRESLSEVLELSITALIDNEKAGLTRLQAEAVLAGRPESTVTPVAAAVERPRPDDGGITSPAAAIADRPPSEPVVRSRWANAGPSYAALAPGGGLAIMHGPGVFLAAGAAGRHAGLGAWISGQYQLPARQAAPAVGVQLQTIAVRGGIELRIPLGPYHVSARLGLGADAVHVSPEVGEVDRRAVLAPAHWSQSLVFTAAAGVRRSIGSRFVLGAGVLADVVPTVVHYDLNVAGTTAEVLSPHRVRPGLMVEFLVD